MYLTVPVNQLLTADGRFAAAKSLMATSMPWKSEAKDAVGKCQSDLFLLLDVGLLIESSKFRGSLHLVERHFKKLPPRLTVR